MGRRGDVGYEERTGRLEHRIDTLYFLFFLRLLNVVTLSNRINTLFVDNLDTY